MKKLPIHFYKREDVVLIARELIGKIIVTSFDGIITSGRIVETEAYIGLTDKASHSLAANVQHVTNICMQQQAQLMFISVTACTIYLM